MEDRTVFQPVAFGSVKLGVCFNGIYEIVAFITQGGMGEVYRGFNIQTGDSVAIKMIRPELTNNPDVLELFKREAKTLHKLAHEAIVRYFVFTVDPDTGRAYLAMEFVDGPSLTNRIESGPLPLADVKILQMRIASALEAAHHRGSYIATSRPTTSSCRRATCATPRSSTSASRVHSSGQKSRSSAADSPANTTTPRPSNLDWPAGKSPSSPTSTASAWSSRRRSADDQSICAVLRWRRSRSAASCRIFPTSIRRSGRSSRGCCSLCRPTVR